jgi:hypothetical protein
MADMKPNKRGRKPSPDSKRATGEDRHTKPRKSFHADKALFDAVAAYRQATRPTPTETEVFITAVEEFLERKGHWPPPGETE